MQGGRIRLSLLGVAARIRLIVCFVSLPRVSAGVVENVGCIRHADFSAKQLRLALAGMIEVRANGSGRQPKIEADTVLSVGSHRRLRR